MKVEALTHKMVELFSDNGKHKCAVWCADPSDDVPEMEAQRMIPKPDATYSFPKAERVHVACIEVWSQWSHVMVSEKAFVMLKQWMLMTEAQNATKH